MAEKCPQHHSNKHNAHELFHSNRSRFIQFLENFECAFHACWARTRAVLRPPTPFGIQILIYPRVTHTMVEKLRR